MVTTDRTKDDVITKWSETASGVLLITYDNFSNMTEPVSRQVQATFFTFQCVENTQL